MLGQIINFDKEATLRVRQHRRGRVQERMQLVQKEQGLHLRDQRQRLPPRPEEHQEDQVLAKEGTQC